MSLMFLSRDFFSRSNNFVLHMLYRGFRLLFPSSFFDVKHYSVHRSVILQKCLIAAKVHYVTYFAQLGSNVKLLSYGIRMANFYITCLGSSGTSTTAVVTVLVKRAYLFIIVCIGSR